MIEAELIKGVTYKLEKPKEGFICYSYENEYKMIALHEQNFLVIFQKLQILINEMSKCFAPVLHNEPGVREWNDTFKPMMNFIECVEIPVIFFTTDTKGGVGVCLEGNQLTYVMNNEGFDTGHQILVIIVIEIFSIPRKTKGTNRTDKITGIKNICTSKSLNHPVNKFC